MIDFMRTFYQKNYRFQGFKVLGRVACLGEDIIKEIGLRKGLLNHQKARVDFLLELSKNNIIKPDIKEITSFLVFNYMSGIIKQLTFDFFKRKQPDLILIDSFSELTDQMFENKKNGKKFLANYGDIKHDKFFELKYINKGLLEIDKIYDIYDEFFEKLNLRFHATPIVFIHFPTKLDNRDNFKERGDVIRESIDKLSGKYKNLYSISIKDSLVKKSEDESDKLKDFPYHYSKETYNAFVIQVMEVLKKRGITINVS